MRTTLSIAAAVLLSLGITPSADASSVTPFGVSLNANSCAYGATYNTGMNGGGGTVGATGDTSCSDSGTAPDATATGLIAASVSTSSTQEYPGYQGLTASDSASADLSSASLHAFATGISNNNGDGSPGGNASATFWDTLTFTISGATVSTVTHIPIFFSVDGSDNSSGANTNAAPGESWGADMQFSAPNCLFNGCGGGIGNVTWSGNNNGTLTSQFSTGSPNFASGESINWGKLGVNDGQNFEIEGTLSLTGTSADISLSANLYANAGNGTADYSNTAGISFDLPDGTSFTSASTVFDTTPEPASLFLCGSALVLGLGFRRLRKKS